MSNQRILTGHRPTGPRHIGHLVATLENWTRLQDTHECFFLVADLHVLTTHRIAPERIQVNILNMLADWLAVGIDSTRSTIVLQSIIPEHTQLSALFSMLTTVERLERVSTYKEQIEELNLQPSLGLLTYPVLQAADILLYKAQVVPVGKSQLPHIELSRETARNFNETYGDTFPEPEALLSKAASLPGTDNRNMRTSYGNAIYLSDTDKETEQKVISMYTDPGHVDNNPVFVYHDIFNPDKAEVDELKAQYLQGKITDMEVKSRLVEVLNAYLAPLRERRAEIISQPKKLLEVLFSGTVKAKFIAQQTLEEAHQRMGLLHSRSFSDKVLATNIPGIF